MGDNTVRKVEKGADKLARKVKSKKNLMFFSRVSDPVVFVGLAVTETACIRIQCLRKDQSRIM